MLPSRTVEQIFARLLVRYGAQWIRMWDGVPMEAVHADWAEELGQTKHEAIRYALDYLPHDRPPNAAQFKAICNGFRGSEPRAITPPKADPETVQRAIAAAKASLKANDPKAWARRLFERHEAGEVIRPYNLNLAREALAGDRDREPGEEG